MIFDYYKKAINRYDWFIILIIGSLAFGRIGGAFQFIRILSICLIPSNIFFLIFSPNKQSNRLITLYFIFLFIYGFISLNWSINLLNSIIELVYIFLSINIVYSLICFSKKANRVVESLVYGWSLFMILTLPIAMWEFLTSNHLPTMDGLISTVDARGRALNGVIEIFAGTTFGNPNEYNTVIAFCLPFIFLNVLQSKTINQYLFSFILLLLTVIVPIINSSRGALISIIIDVIIFLYYYKKNKTNNLAIIILSIIIVSAIFILYGADIFNQLMLRSENVNALEDNGRLFMIMMGIDLLEESNYMGIGPMGYKTLFQTGPHNLFVEFAVEYGLICLTFGLIVLIYIVCNLYKKTRNSIYSYIPISFIFSLPFCSVINSDYLEYPFLWIIFGSLYIMSININKLCRNENIN